MSTESESRIPEVMARHEQSLLADWLQLQTAASGSRRDRLSEAQLAESAREFLSALQQALRSSTSYSAAHPVWNGVRDVLSNVSRQQAVQGASPSETATFVFSLKQPLFQRLRQELADKPETLADEIWFATQLLDQLGLYTIEVHQRSREEVITRQQQDMMELSTPVVSLWENILALPLIGTLDSGRTQVVMQNLLEAIVSHRAVIAIIDITGVPTVDTLVAQHLLKTVAAARLMGADCIISGVRPQIAQTIIHLGVDLSNVITKATLSDAFSLALRKLNLRVVEARSKPSASQGE